MLWRARGAVVSSANRPVGVPSCLAPPRPTALPWVVPPRPFHDIFVFWIRQVLHWLCMYLCRRIPPGRLHTVCWRSTWKVVLWPDCAVVPRSRPGAPAPLVPSLPRPRPALLRPTLQCSTLSPRSWDVRVLDSTNWVCHPQLIWK